MIKICCGNCRHWESEKDCENFGFCISPIPIWLDSVATDTRRGMQIYSDDIQAANCELYESKMNWIKDALK